MIDTTKKVKRLMLEKNINMTQLAEKIGTSQPNLSKKMKNNSLSVVDLEKIAIALDVQFEVSFTLEGEKI